MPLVTRTLSVSYGSWSSSDTGYQLFGAFAFDGSFPVASVAFQVLVQGSSEAQLRTREAALVAAFGARRQRLRVILSGGDRYDYDPATYTGFDAEPRCRKVGGPYDTAVSALYDCSVEVQLPSDDQAGRTFTSLSVRQAASGKRFVTLAGVMTARSAAGGGPDSASAVYAADIEAHADALLDSVDATVDWRPVSPGDTQQNDTDTEVVWSRSYEEPNNLVPYLEGVRVPELVIRTEAVEARGGVEGTRASRVVSAMFTAEIDRTETTEPGTLWPQVQELLETQIQEEVGGVFAFTRATHDDAISSNRISGMVYGLAFETNLIASRVVVTDIHDEGLVFRDVADGVDYSANVYQGPKRHRKVVSREFLSLGVEVFEPPPTPPNFYRTGRVVPIERVYRGVDGEVLLGWFRDETTFRKAFDARGGVGLGQAGGGGQFTSVAPGAASNDVFFQAQAPTGGE